MIDHRPEGATYERAGTTERGTLANVYPDLDHTGGAHRQWRDEEVNDIQSPPPITEQR